MGAFIIPPALRLVADWR